MSSTAEDAPARGDVVEFRTRSGRKMRGTVSSTYATRTGQPRVTAKAAGKRYTHSAASVSILTRGEAPASTGRPGQQPGQPAPNSADDYAAQVLTLAEVSAILGACSARSRTGIRNRALLTMLYRSGLRIGEALAVRPADLDMDAHSIRLLGTKSGQAQTRAWHPSGDDALARWLDTRRDLPTSRSSPVFCTLAGGPVHPQYARNLLHRLGEQAGLGKRVHPHAFRHTFAYELLKAGTPIDVISKLLGHSSIAITARYLDHLTNHEAVTALGAVDLPALE